MNKLDLNAYNVSEMNVAEMQETNGGFLITIAAAATVSLLVIEMARLAGYRNGLANCTC